LKTQYYLTTVCLSFLLTIITSCSKNDNYTFDNQNLTGTWKWVRTDGGIANHIHETPASTGNNIDLKITSDYKYFIYTNGTLSSQGTYNLEIRNCIHDHTDKNVINFSTSTDPDMMIENVDNLNLELSDDVYDGTSSLYVRN